MTRETRRVKATINGKFFFTEEEELQADADEQAWADGADDRAAAANRETRNQLLSDSDWTQMPDSPVFNEVKAGWAIYRTSLRNLTAHENWPNLADDDWPTKP